MMLALRYMNKATFGISAGLNYFIYFILISDCVLGLIELARKKVFESDA